MNKVVRFDREMARAVLRMRLQEHRSMQHTARVVGVGVDTLRKYCAQRGLPLGNASRHPPPEWNFAVPSAGEQTVCKPFDGT